MASCQRILKGILHRPPGVKTLSCINSAIRPLSTLSGCVDHCRSFNVSITSDGRLGRHFDQQSIAELICAKRVITAQTEHKYVLNSSRGLARLPVKQNGIIDLLFLKTPEILDPVVNRVPLGSPTSGGKEYIIPGANNYSGKTIDDPIPSMRIPTPIQEAPSQAPRPEKHAARLIVIRRTKMNKHKLRKLRKKMHYKWSRIKDRRYIRKEKAYLDQKLALIHAAMKFDAKDYVAGVIKKAKEEPLARKWTDPLMPDWYREQEMEKEARLKRFQKVVNMYINKDIKIKME